MMAKYSSKSLVIMGEAHTLLSDGYCRLSPPEIPSKNRNSHQQLALWDSVHFPVRLIVMCLSLSSWPGGALKSITSIPISAKRTAQCLVYKIKPKFKNKLCCFDVFLLL